MTNQLSKIQKVGTSYCPPRHLSRHNKPLLTQSVPQKFELEYHHTY